MFENPCVSLGPQLPSDKKGEGGDGLPARCRAIRQQEPPILERQSQPSVMNHSYLRAAGNLLNTLNPKPSVLRLALLLKIVLTHHPCVLTDLIWRFH